MGWNLLSDEDVRIVQMLIDREKRRLETEDIQEQEEFDGDYITDHHLVYVPTGGLPAWDGQTGTGTNSLDLFQECEVYRPADDLDEADVEEAGFTLVVHNPYLTDIEGDQFVTVTKDKFGRWYPTSLGGSGLVEPSIYVVRVPTGGINALNTNTTTGTSPEGDLDDDIVDYAQCEVFQLMEPCSEGARFVSKGFTVCVHNLGYCHIEGGRFIRALRDEYGVWWADEPVCEDPRPVEEPASYWWCVEPPAGTGTGTHSGETGTGGGVDLITTTCCPAGVPETLTVTLTGGTCARVITLVHYTGSVWIPLGSVAGEYTIGTCTTTGGGPSMLTFTLQCSGTTWTLSFYDSFDFIDYINVVWNSGTYTCSPFSLNSASATSFSQFMSGGCGCSTNYTSITVTG